MNQVPLREPVNALVVGHPPHQVHLFRRRFVERPLHGRLVVALEQGQHVALQVLDQRVLP